MKTIATLLVSLSMLLQSPDDDPFVRHRRGQELARQGKDQEALIEYLWCLEHGIEQSNEYALERMATLFPDIVALAKKYQPALDALHDRMNAAEAMILGGSHSWFDTEDFITLCDALHESDRAIALFDRMDPGNLRQRSTRHAVVIRFADELVEQQRYDAIVEIMGDAETWVARQRKDILDMAGLVKDKSDAGDVVRQMLLRTSVRGRIPYYEALLATEDAVNATKLADILIECDGRSEVFQRLSDAARRAGKDDVAQGFERRAAGWERNATTSTATTQPK